MPNLNPITAERNRSIAQDRIAGYSYKKLCEKYDLSLGGMNYVLTDNEVKDVVESGVRAQVSMIPLANQVIRDRLIDKDEPKLQFEAAKEVNKNTCFPSSHTQSPVIINVFNQHNTIVNDVKVLQAFDRYANDNDIGQDLGLNHPDNPAVSLSPEGDM